MHRQLALDPPGLSSPGSRDGTYNPSAITSKETKDLHAPTPSCSRPGPLLKVQFCNEPGRNWAAARGYKLRGKGVEGAFDGWLRSHRLCPGWLTGNANALHHYLQF